MKIVLVGIRRGKRVINWRGVLLVSLIVGIVSGCSGAATWYLLTEEFSLFGIIFPVFLFIGFFVGLGIRQGLSVPREQLDVLD